MLSLAAHVLLVVSFVILTVAFGAVPDTIGLSPDWFCLYALFLALFSRNRGAGPLPVIAAGLVKDVLTAGSFGGFALLYWIVYLHVHRRRDQWFRDRLASQMIIVALAAGFIHGCQALAVMLALPAAPPIDDLLLRTVSIAGATALMTPIAFAAFRAVFGIVGVRQTATGDLSF